MDSQPLRIKVETNQLGHTHCRRGHAYSEFGYFNGKQVVCLQCRRDGKNRRSREKAGLAGEGLIQGELDKSAFLSIQLKKAWVRRKEKWGEVGMPAETAEKVAQQTSDRLRRDGHHMAKKTHCVRGHRFREGSYRLYRGRRICLECSRRPKWVVHEGVKTNLRLKDKFFRIHYRSLKIDLINAHPDKGGTDRKFQNVQRKLDFFLARERRWYKEANVPMPSLKIRMSSGRTKESYYLGGKKGWVTRRAKSGIIASNEIDKAIGLIP